MQLIGPAARFLGDLAMPAFALTFGALEIVRMSRHRTAGPVELPLFGHVGVAYAFCALLVVFSPCRLVLASRRRRRQRAEHRVVSLREVAGRRMWVALAAWRVVAVVLPLALATIPMIVH